jgi:SRSO17 transposase
MAAATAPAQVSAKHQSLLHVMGKAPWSDKAVMAKVCEQILPALEQSGPIREWIIDDMGFSKKRKHSVGVGRPYCGRRGKQDNGQVAVTLSIAAYAFLISERETIPPLRTSQLQKTQSACSCRK